MAGVGGGSFAGTGVEDGLGKEGDGEALRGETGEEGGAGGAGDGLVAVDMALGLVEAGAFAQGLDRMPEKGSAGERTEEGIAERAVVGEGAPLESAKGFLADLGKERPERAQAFEIQIAVKPAITEEKFVPQNVGFHREIPGGIEGIAVHHVEGSGIAIRPELVMPARMMAAPPVGPRFGLHGERIRAEPDLMDEAGKAGGKG